jgi:hypothetical protein
MNINSSTYFTVNKFFVGLLTTLVLVFVLGAIFGGELVGNDAGFIASGVSTLNIFLSVAFASVVCTVGISLVVWIPIMCLVGQVSYFVLRIKEPVVLPDKKISKDDGVKDIDNLLPLINYIVEARKNNMKDDEIKINLRRGGWKDSDIEKALMGIKK